MARSAGRVTGGVPNRGAAYLNGPGRSVSQLPAPRGSRPAQMLRTLVVLAVVLLASACGGEEEPELTLEDRLEVIEGRPLTAVEVADRLSVASALCELDEPILDAVWRRLSEEQLEFQDFVFAHICPDRSIFYAGLTGRYVTEEAEESGVVTSTTPPIRTTTTAETATTVAAADPLSSAEDGTTSAPAAGVEATTETSETAPDAASTTTTGALTPTTLPEGEGG